MLGTVSRNSGKVSSALWIRAEDSTQSRCITRLGMERDDPLYQQGKSRLGDGLKGCYANQPVTECSADVKAENYTAPPANDVRRMGMVLDNAAHGSRGAIQAGYSSYMFDVIENWIPYVSSVCFERQKADDKSMGQSRFQIQGSRRWRYP